MDSATSELPARTPLADAAETGLKIVVVGGSGVGKTTLVRSVSEIRPLNTEEVMTEAGVGVDETAGLPNKTTTTVAFDFGRISLTERLLDGDIPAWLVLGYSEASYITSHHELFARDSRRWNQWPNIPEDWPLTPFVGYQPSVMFTEGAEHQRRAGVITETLEAIDQFELSRICQDIAEGLIDTFAGSGKAELVTEYAPALPLRTALHLCGLSSAGAVADELVRDLRITLDTAPDEDQVTAYRRLADRVDQLIKDQRNSVGSNITSRMLTHPAELTDEEIRADLTAILSAVQQQTSNWISNGLRLLMTDDRFALNVAGGRLSVGQALNEVVAGPPL